MEKGKQRATTPAQTPPAERDDDQDSEREADVVFDLSLAQGHSTPWQGIRTTNEDENNEDLEDSDYDLYDEDPSFRLIGETFPHSQSSHGLDDYMDTRDHEEPEVVYAPPSPEPARGRGMLRFSECDVLLTRAKGVRAEAEAADADTDEVALVPRHGSKKLSVPFLSVRVSFLMFAADRWLSPPYASRVCVW